MSTYRTLRDGSRVDNDGRTLSDDLNAIPIRVQETTYTGTELQSMNTTPITLVPAVTGKTIFPISWHTILDHAGGTDFSGNTSLEITNDSNVIGEATSALGGSADLKKSGTLVSTTCVAGAELAIQVKTGDPTGGHATASLLVRVLYILV
jgi:hypothetical protein